ADETITVDDDIILYGKFSKKAVPVIPDTGVNSQNENSSSSNQADLIIISTISILSLVAITIADRLYRRHRISKF
ncbi:hypothetical protein IKG33_02370, partial [Candidatus Saccharibacteria bacterium]|nr:hypothetical protein [Candidatus Saccharibacteria bacterium]MBR3132229.1 hypothetical protein [Candidatus Saccharibacteria bacterium]